MDYSDPATSLSCQAAIKAAIVIIPDVGISISPSTSKPGHAVFCNVGYHDPMKIARLLDLDGKK